MQAKGAMEFLLMLTGLIGNLLFKGVGIGRRWRTAQASKPGRMARLEALRTKAHLLAGISHDSYGAQRYCLEIIGQTEKEDPLFMEACDLYMRTVTARSGRGPNALPGTCSTPRQIGARPVPAATNVILFPRRSPAGSQ